MVELGIAFDFEGAVVDVEPCHHGAHIVSALKEAGLNMTNEDFHRYIEHFIGGPDDEVAEDIARLAADIARITGGPEVKVDSKNILARKRSEYDNSISDFPIQPREGYLDFIKEIKQRGYPFSLGSLTERAYAENLLVNSGLFEIFGNSYQRIVLREDVENAKPAPDVWIETSKRMGVNKANQIVVEDSPRGIKGAMEIGAYCIGMPVYDKLKVRQDLREAGARHVFTNWDDFRRGLDDVLLDYSKGRTN
jgi:beta-phosphoglucomutase-like phosphatase (HAD superfamily)